MSFDSLKYDRFLSTHSFSQSRLFSQYFGSETNFHIIIIGSGIGGGVLADDLADRLGKQKRILVIEAGSYLYPTHVYNVCRFPNSEVARRFACRTFFQKGNQGSQRYIHEEPQLNFGGRSIFWSGLIPIMQAWELEFFPSQVKGALASGLLTEAGAKMNESVTMGTTAQAIVNKLRQSSLVQDFSIQETPRALHQPYLTREGLPTNRFFIEPTGVFNTAELLINQVDIAPGGNVDGAGLKLLLNHFVEDVKNAPGNRLEVVTLNTLNGQIRNFQADTVVLAGGSIESPKLLRRSTLFPSLPNQVQPLVGIGLTDHPTTHPIETFVTNIDNVPIPRDAHAKIIFYSRGLRDAQDEIRYPFNVEMNINHEYWHLRQNDPSASNLGNDPGASRLDIKFSFGNCLDVGNKVKPTIPSDYVPEIEFRNMNWIDHLASERFPALAGWNKSFAEVFAVLNDITYRIFSQFQINGQEPRPVNEAWNGQQGKGFGFGTVHHAVGTLRMPHRPTYTAAFQPDSVVDENLKVVGTQNLYVCDMSVMPFSSAANPVRTLVALALRLSRHLG